MSVYCLWLITAIQCAPPASLPQHLNPLLYAPHDLLEEDGVVREDGLHADKHYYTFYSAQRFT